LAAIDRVLRPAGIDQDSEAPRQLLKEDFLISV
jgi:hypothetical protein